MAVTAHRRGKVLVGFADALAAPEVAWSLLDAGWQVIAFSRRGTRPTLALDRRVEIVEICPPEQDVTGCADDIARAVTSEGVVVVLPMDDGAVRLCDLARPQWQVSSSAVLAGPTGPQLELALDKRTQLSAARAAGLNVPAEFEAEQLKPSDLPVVVKPAFAVQVRDNRLVRENIAFCRTRADVDRAVAQARGPTIVQQTVQGVGEGLFCIAADGRAAGWSAHRRVRMMNPSGSGASACRAAAVDPDLAERAGRFLSAAGWTGIAMIELLRDAADTVWFMELNGRTWGSTALSRRSGLEYPAWAVDCALGLPVLDDLPEPPLRAETVRHAGRELVHLLTVLRGPRSATPAPWPPRSTALREVLTWRRSDRWYNAQPGMRRLFVYDTVRTVVGAVRGRARG